MSDSSSLSPESLFPQLTERVVQSLAKRRFQEAEQLCATALRHDPRHVGFLNLLGQAQLAQNRFSEAVPHFEQAIRLQPELPNLHFNLALAFQGIGRINEAVEASRRAVALDPSVASLHTKLGQLLLMQGESEFAEASLVRACELAPQSLPSQINLAQAQVDLGKIDEAEATLQGALRQNPTDFNATMAMGRLRQQQGRFEEARERFDRAATLQPQAAAPYVALAYNRKVGADDRKWLRRIEPMLSQPTRSLADRSNLHYAMGKAFDDLAEYENAIHNFDRANEMCLEIRKAAGQKFDRNTFSLNLSRVLDFAESGPQIAANYRSASERPVFIVGMIRSGTTLVESILASHPDVAAGGEQPFWALHVAKTLSASTHNQMDSAWIEETIRAYDAVLDRVSASKPRVTDKMPTNANVIGIIHQCYPNARFIHCKRHPVDNCLSIYVTPYRMAPEYAHDREEIVFGYEQHSKLMDRWRSEYPEAQIFDVNYERLIQDREAMTREMIAFLGLEWDPKCLEQGQGQATIQTPSLWQVRQPIYKSSVERWRNYEPWLGALHRLLPR